MCGIFGTTTLNANTRPLLPFLALEMEDRGTQSWGASNGYDTIRELGRITSGWWEQRPILDTWAEGIFHTRQASQGKVTIENAHPFTVTADDRTIIGIHNGCIYSHDHLNKLHGRSLEVDSQHIWQHMIERKPLEELRGWGALAWWEILGETPPVLHLGWFSAHNLYLIQLPTGEYVFASTLLSLLRAAELNGLTQAKIWPLTEDREYIIASGMQAPVELGPLGFNPTKNFTTGNYASAAGRAAYNAYLYDEEELADVDWNKVGSKTATGSGTESPFGCHVATGEHTSAGGCAGSVASKATMGVVGGPSSANALDVKCAHCSKLINGSRFMCFMCFGDLLDDWKKTNPISIGTPRTESTSIHVM